jgi:flagellar hook protein FlgE
MGRMDAINAALTGMQNATARFNASAQRMVGGQGDLVSEIVEQVSSEQAFKASLAVVRTGDEMMKRLLDIKV